jgi:hypothetical protein
MKRYESIVFLQGDEAEPALRELREDGPAALLEYLRQWDYGEPGEERPEPAAGTDDDTWLRDGYLVTWNSRIGYCGLERVRERGAG